MTKSSFWISCLLCLAALSTIAAGPPNIDKALEAQYELVAERPYEASAHNDLGNLLALVNRWDDAAQAYQKAIDLDPGDTSARFNLALLHAQQGRHGEAEAELRSVVELAPGHGRAYYQLGIIYSDKGERKNATEAYARAFAADPTLTFASNNPHIIENEYRMEALLMAERFETSPETEQPRVYQEPDRIRRLMVPEPEKTADADSEEAPVSEDEGDYDAEDDPGYRSDLRDDEDDPGYEGAAANVERGSATSNRAETQQGQPAASRPSATPTRTRRRPSGVGAGSSYRPPNRSGQVGGVSRPQGNQRRQGTNTGSGSRSESEFSNDSGRSETQAPIPSARPRRVGRVGYNSGRASTGRLDLDLLPLEGPGSEEEVTVASRR